MANSNTVRRTLLARLHVGPEDDLASIYNWTLPMITGPGRALNLSFSVPKAVCTQGMMSVEPESSLRVSRVILACLSVFLPLHQTPRLSKSAVAADGIHSASQLTSVCAGLHSK